MSFESYLKVISSEPIAFSRLLLQEKILERGTRKFLSLLRRNKFLSNETILCLGFAGAGEINLIREYFPGSAIIAVDRKREYVDMARKRIKDKKVHFYLLDDQGLSNIINKFSNVGAVYWRSFLMHSKDAKIVMLEAKKKVKKHIKFFIEEPDVSTIKTVPYSEAFEIFSNLGVQYGRLKSEDFCIGQKLVDILSGVGVRFECVRSYHPKLFSSMLEIFQFLMDDLFPVYKKLGLSTAAELSLLRKNMLILIRSQQSSFYFYRMKQVAFSLNKL